MKKLLLPLLLLMLCSCEQFDKNSFLAIADVRLEVLGGGSIVYESLGWQQSYNPARNEFRVCTDTASDYFILTLSQTPSFEGQQVTGSLKWTTYSTVESKKNIAFEVIKIEGDKIWLSSKNGQFAACVRLI